MHHCVGYRDLKLDGLSITTTQCDLMDLAIDVMQCALDLPGERGTNQPYDGCTIVDTIRIGRNMREYIVPVDRALMKLSKRDHMRFFRLTP